MTLGRCPLSTFCSRGTPQPTNPTLSLSPMSNPLLNCRKLPRKCFEWPDSAVFPACTARHSSQFQNNHLTEMCSGSEAGSYLRRIDCCITQLKAQGPSRTCNESQEKDKCAHSTFSHGVNTPHPALQTLNPRPQPLNPESQTLNPEP